MKGFKVANASRRRLIGVTCSSLEELKIKGCQKLQIQTDVKNVTVYLTDGTIVDDDMYFKSLPSQSVLILKQPGEQVTSGFDLIFGALRSININLLETESKVNPFFDEDAQRKIALLSQFFKKEEDKKRASLSLRSDDPEWFEGLDTYVQTKEEFMRKRSSGRIQRYFYDAKDKIKNSYQYSKNISTQKFLYNVFNDFYARLSSDDFFACYFDRTSAERAMCDRDGLFICQGVWNSDNCSYMFDDVISDHQINPYTSKETRVIFSSWNLDHRIERSRSIIPSLLKASEICCGDTTYQINSEYFYDLFFKRINLKLVHIVCHDKNEHKSATCDLERIVIKMQEPLTTQCKSKRRFPSTSENSIDHMHSKRSRRILQIRH